MEQADILVITPHPDDAEFGVAGTVARWTKQGKQVVYVVCTNGNKGTSDPDIKPDELAEIRQGHMFTRVIMVTGHGTMETQRRAFREFQAFDFFRKEQFDSEEFRQGVREAVEQAARDRRTWKEHDYMRGHHYETWQRKQG